MRSATARKKFTRATRARRPVGDDRARRFRLAAKAAVERNPGTECRGSGDPGRIARAHSIENGPRRCHWGNTPRLGQKLLPRLPQSAGHLAKNLGVSSRTYSGWDYRDQGLKSRLSDTDAFVNGAELTRTTSAKSLPTIPAWLEAMNAGSARLHGCIVRQLIPDFVDGLPG